jgi:starch synthase
MITPEQTPFAQTGGLGEVMASLPNALVRLGVEVDVLMPKYRGINTSEYNIKRMDGLEPQIDLNAKIVKAKFWEMENQGGPRLLFLECDEYFDREHLYGDEEKDYSDNSERFVFLCRAAMELSLAENRYYDVFHAHDWQAALTPVYLRTFYAGESLLFNSASVMTIHNLGYQGIFWHYDMPLVGLGWEFFTPRYMEFHGKVNFLKSGIVFADQVNTVSQGYRNEILTSEFGFGLEGVLLEKGDSLQGILNGVDYSIWNPETDDLIAQKYSPINLSGKGVCKRDFQKYSSLPPISDAPLLAMVSRLSSQKGIDILEGAMSQIVNMGCQFTLLGAGDPWLQESFRKIAQQYPNNVKVFFTYDYELAHKIFAAADMLLAPSRYEPCGLNQLYAMKYGAAPIVRDTGGLMDTVEQYKESTDTGAGFKFRETTPEALVRNVQSAVDLYSNYPDKWERLIKRCMSQDFSWDRSAREYLRLYERAVENRRHLVSRDI